MAEGRAATARAPAVAEGLAAAARAAFTSDASEVLLNSSLVRRGFELPVWEDGRLACLLRKLKSGRSITIAVLGGSVSAGSVFGVKRGPDGAWLYHRKVVSALQTIFPTEVVPRMRNGSAHRVHNGALPATGPAWFEHCLESQLPFRRDGTVAADLVLIDFALNIDGQPAAFERMIRKLLMMPRSHALPALLVVNLHAWNRADVLSGRLQRKTCFKWVSVESRAVNALTVEQSLTRTQRSVQTWNDVFNSGDEDVTTTDSPHRHCHLPNKHLHAFTLERASPQAIARLCKHYNIPLVSMRGALLQSVVDDSSVETRLATFMVDCKHPNSQGHTYMAQLIVGRILAAGHENHILSHTRCRAKPEPIALPPPLLPNGWEMPSSRCASGQQLSRYLISARGFSLSDEGRGKFGLVATSSGSVVTLSLGNMTNLSLDQKMGSAVALEAGSNNCSDAGPGEAKRMKWMRKSARRVIRCSDEQGRCVEPIVQHLCRATCGLCPQGGSAATTGFALWLAYLHSHQLMGRARLSCLGACTCESEVDAHNRQRQSSVTAVQLIQISPRDARTAMSVPTASHHETECQLSVRVLPATTSGGHKFKVIGLLFAPRKENKWQPPGTHMDPKFMFDLAPDGLHS